MPLLCQQGSAVQRSAALPSQPQPRLERLADTRRLRSNTSLTFDTMVIAMLQTAVTGGSSDVRWWMAHHDQCDDLASTPAGRVS